ncbi:MAG: FliM/FliN family flagellar motor C-terminal domain-containing protein [Anaeromyxobacter sp.]
MPSGLLTPADSARARPFRCYTAAERAEVARVAGVALGDWASAWGLDEPSCGAEAEAVFAARERGLGAAGRWTRLEGAAGLWWQVEGGAAEAGSRLEAALFGAAASPSATRWDSPPAASAEAAQGAWGDLQARLRVGLGAEKSDAMYAASVPAAGVLGGFSGSLVLRLRIPGLELAVLVAPEVVGRLVPLHRAPAAPARPLAPVFRALASRRASLHVQLSAFELDLGALAALRVGDVVRTTHRLDVPATVLADGACSGHGEPLAHCYLGRLGAHRAIELAAAGHPNPSHEIR